MKRRAFDFVMKPIDFADLEATIAKTLRSMEINRGLQRRQQEAERARAQLARYFSPSLADRLTGVELGAERRVPAPVGQLGAGLTKVTDKEIKAVYGNVQSGL
jgi:adenylate cyclase